MIHKIPGSKKLGMKRWEKCVHMMSRDGITGAAAWRKTAGKPITAANCASASWRMRKDPSFKARFEYLKAHPEDMEAAPGRDYEALEDKLWSIIESIGAGASKDGDVIRAISEMAKLRERMIQGAQACADNALVASTLTRILTDGITAVCPNDDELIDFVSALSDVLKRDVSITGERGQVFTHTFKIKEKTEIIKDETTDGCGQEGESEGEYNDTEE